MSLSALQTMLYSRLGYPPATVDATVVARMLSYLNETHRQILSAKGMGILRRIPVTFASTANSSFAVLPQAATRVITIRDVTNRKRLDPMSLDDLRYEDPGLAFSSAVPYGFQVYNLASAVLVQPAAAVELVVLSSLAGDGATKTATVEGLTTGGYYRVASAVMNGIGAAVSFGPTDWIEIQKFYLSLTAGGPTTASGLVQLKQTSSAGILTSVIPAGRQYARFTTIQLYPQPTAAVTYTADVELHVEDMALAGDEPLVPEDYHDLLVIGSLMKEYSRREKPIQYAEEKANWKERMAVLRSYVGKLSGSETRRTSVQAPYSQLGANFPAGS